MNKLSKLPKRDNPKPPLVNFTPNLSEYALKHDTHHSDDSLKLSFKKIKNEETEKFNSFTKLHNTSVSLPCTIKQEPDEQFEFKNRNEQDECLTLNTIKQETFLDKLGENNNFETSIKSEEYYETVDDDDYFEEFIHTPGGKKASERLINSENDEVKVETEPNDPPTKYSCNHCSYSSPLKKCFNRHIQIHMDPEQIQWYHCDKCNYKTRQSGHLRRHKLTHKDLSECREIYICAICQYKFKQKGTLKRHIMDIHGAHKDGSKSKTNPDLPVYKCTECSYSSIRKSLFLAHLDKHKDPKDVSNLYICDICKFSTKYRRNLRVHLEIHRENLDKTIHECKICDYRTRLHYCLKRHLLSKRHLTIVGKRKEYCPREARMKQEDGDTSEEEVNVEEFVEVKSEVLKMEMDDDEFEAKEVKKEFDYVEVKVEGEVNS